MGKGNAHNLEWTWRIAAAQPPRKFGLQLQLQMQPMDGCRWSQTKWRHALLIFIMHLHLSFGCTCSCINVIPFGSTFGTLASFRTLSNVMRVCKVIYAVCVCVCGMVCYGMIWSDLIWCATTKTTSAARQMIPISPSVVHVTRPYRILK